VLQVGGAGGRVRDAGGAGRGTGGTIRGAGGTVRGAGTDGKFLLDKRKLGLRKRGKTRKGNIKGVAKKRGQGRAEKDVDVALNNLRRPRPRLFLWYIKSSVAVTERT
jgi:hypothetical protein